MSLLFLPHKPPCKNHKIIWDIADGDLVEWYCKKCGTCRPAGGGKRILGLFIKGNLLVPEPTDTFRFPMSNRIVDPIKP